MVIDFVTYGFPPQSNGGTQVYTANIAAALRNRGHQVAIVAADLAEDRAGPPGWSRDHLNQLPVNRVHYTRSGQQDVYGAQLVLNPDVGRLLAERWRQERPDVVHITYCGHLSAAPVAAAVELDLPVVVTMTDMWFICPLGTCQRTDGQLCDGRQSGRTCQQCIVGDTRASRFLDRLPATGESLALRAVAGTPLANGIGTLNLIRAVDSRNRIFPQLLAHVDLVLSPSRFLRERLIARGLVSPDKIRYFPHGHDLAEAGRGRRKSLSQTVRFGYTGHLLPQKGAHVLIAAFARLPVGHASLTIFGDLAADPAYARGCHDLAGSRPDIQFGGRFDHADTGRILRDLDVVVMPSLLYENAPLTIAEAFAAATPVIVSDLGGMAEAVRHEIDGYLFPPGDVAALSAILAGIAAHPETLEPLRRAIRPVREIAAEAEELEQIYAQLAAARMVAV